MKLKNKLLIALAPAAAIATTMPIALTSCGGNEEGKSTNSVTYAGSKTIETTQSTYQIEFTLAKALATGETVKLSYPVISGSAVPAITNVSGTKITVTITDLTSSAYLPSTTTFSLTFKGYASGSTVVTSWETTITGFTFTKKAA